eukprot:1180370-Prorocentrum_minimum.AAC.4
MRAYTSESGVVPKAAANRGQSSSPPLAEPSCETDTTTHVKQERHSRVKHVIACKHFTSSRLYSRSPKDAKVAQ